MSETKLKESLELVGEEWTPEWQRVSSFSPDYLAAYTNLRRVSVEERVLPAKVQELILLAMDVQCTHLYYPGVAAHTTAALRAGASVEEVVETLEVCSVLGVHAVAVGAPILEDVLRERGEKFPNTWNEQQQRAKSLFEKEKGWWSERFDPILRYSPSFFEAYTRYSALPFQKGHSHLDLKIKELLYVAIDCVTTHLFEPGLRIHVRKALDVGATPEEIMEVFQLATLMGSQTVFMGTEALAKELKS